MVAFFRMNRKKKNFGIELTTSTIKHSPVKLQEAVLVVKRKPDVEPGLYHRGHQIKCKCKKSGFLRVEKSKMTFNLNYTHFPRQEKIALSSPGGVEQFL